MHPVGFTLGDCSGGPFQKDVQRQVVLGALKRWEARSEAGIMDEDERQTADFQRFTSMVCDHELGHLYDAVRQRVFRHGAFSKTTGAHYHSSDSLHGLPGHLTGTVLKHPARVFIGSGDEAVE
jgi:hypothetical protein